MSQDAQTSVRESSNNPHELQRLASQKNWLLWQSQKDQTNLPFACEYEIYSDTAFTGQILEGLGPYRFLNTLPWIEAAGQVRATLALRVDFHIEAEIPDMGTTDESLYHGGSTIADEIAALASLALGRRILAGEVTREFGTNADPRGQPRHGRPPQIPLVQSNRNGPPILPQTFGRRSLDDLNRLSSIPDIGHERYVKLVRACKAYQQALWIADLEPNMAWLLLVSSLETAAGDEIFERQTHEEIFRDAHPSLVHELEREGGEQLVQTVAVELSHLLKSTKKFIQFGMRFLPDPPLERPTQPGSQVNWSRNSMRNILGKIYQYRSRYLHESLPFPAPMLSSRELVMESPPPEHPSVSLGTFSRGGTWVPNDLPINLHCFHYLVRGLLLNWWKRSLAHVSN